MKDLTEGSVFKNMCVFAVPLVLAGLLSQGFNLVDTVIAGKFLGTNGLGAIGATSAYVTFISSLFWGFGTGIALYCGQLFGAKNYKKIKSTFRSNAFFSLLALFVLSVISVAFADPLLSFLKVDAEILGVSKVYFVIFMLGLPIVVYNNYSVYLFNSIGNSTYPLIMSVVSSVLNIIGNIISVTVFSTDERIAVGGVALSTVVSAFAVDVCYIIKLRKGYKAMGVGKEKTFLSPIELKDAARFSLPNAFQQGVMYLARFAVSPIVNALGATATASYTVVLKIYNICSCTYFNASKSIQAHTAQCVGAGKIDRARKGIKAALIQNAMFVTPLILACVIASRPLAMLFFKDSSDVEAISYSVEFMRVFMPFAYLNVVGNVFHGFFKALGARREVIGATVVGAMAQIVASFLFARFFGMTGVFTGWVISWLFDSGYGAYLYKAGRWRKRLKLFNNSAE